MYHVKIQQQRQCTMRDYKLNEVIKSTKCFNAHRLQIITNKYQL